MEERGEVVRSGDGSVDVRLARSAHCDSCGLCESAGVNSMVLPDVKDDIGAAVGDIVSVWVPEGARLKASLWGFGFPIGTLVLGYGVGYLLGVLLRLPPDSSGAVGAGMAVAGLVLWVRRNGWKVMSGEAFRPRVRAIIREARSKA
ncbi:MAG: hypothetical protein Kow0056_06450 [Coriobacteriia bacterium]